MQLSGDVDNSIAPTAPSISDITWQTTVENARTWATLDPNLATADYVKKLISGSYDQKKELMELFPLSDKRIGFGTAGLRSSMKPGPLHMNDLVIVQTAQGIARFCQGKFSPPMGTKLKLGVIIGYDHRANASLMLSSLSFAILTALVFKESGFDDCFLMDGFVPTPLIPFAVNKSNILENFCCIGIMITASHNPKEDAGYKVYWNDGCQIRSPVDTGMAKSITENLIPWIDYQKKLIFLKSKHPNDVCLGLSDRSRTARTIDLYYKTIQQSGLVTGQSKKVGPGYAQKPPRFCYTAMHGVGFRFVKRAFEETFSLRGFRSVENQQEPDPDFPTVHFPNPEEHGALDHAKLIASEGDCDIILANDPDADRLAVAEKCRRTGDWTIFTGDQIGVMLCCWIWEQLGKVDRTKEVAMCASTVSSKMIAEIARVEGFYFEDTLTGFKWIGSRATELSRSGMYRTLFCYEEAIGFCCGDIIFDKDGITALCVFAELSIWVYGQTSSSSLKEHMQSLYCKYGEFVSNNGYYLLDNPKIATKIFDKITNNGTCDTLCFVGTYKVRSIRYLGEPGYDSMQQDKKPRLPTSASSPMLSIWFENGCVAQFRASGTEPKFKYYIELKGKPGVTRDIVTAELERMSRIILELLLEPSRYGLRKP